MDFCEETLRASDITTFFAGKSVFLTGASGFLGKAILEKLLRCCSDIQRIHILMRPKKGISAQERLQKIFSQPLYAETLRRRPEARQKVCVIEGDVLLPQLGISQTDRDTLIREVNVIIHSAASVRFDEPLKDAVRMNMGGTVRVLELASEVENLFSMVHISTAYTNCTRKEAEEKIYELPHLAQGILDMCEWMDSATLLAVSPRILGNFPNTYTCTKAYAEHLVRSFQTAHNLPITIVRPSVVVASWNEPFIGWLDNINGPSGFFMLAGLGLLQAAPVTPRETFPDLVPLDLVVNTVIVAAKHRADPGVEPLPIFHATIGPQNRLSWQAIRAINLRLARTYPMIQMLRYPRVDFALNELHYKYMMLFHHFLPAQVVHYAVSLAGKPSKISRHYQRMVSTIDMLLFFYASDPVFHKQNTEKLYTSLSTTDQYLFNMLGDKMDWEIYLKGYLFGIRYFLLNEDLTTIPAARKRLTVLRVADLAFTPLALCLIYLFIMWLWSCISIASTAISL